MFQRNRKYLSYVFLCFYRPWLLHPWQQWPARVWQPTVSWKYHQALHSSHLCQWEREAEPGLSDALPAAELYTQHEEISHQHLDWIWQPARRRFFKSWCSPRNGLRIFHRRRAHWEPHLWSGNFSISCRWQPRLVPWILLPHCPSRNC